MARISFPLLVFLLATLCAGCGKKDLPPGKPDPVLRTLSEQRRRGLAAAIEYIRRDGGRLVIGFHLTRRPGEGAWVIHPEGDARAHFWDLDGKPLAGPLLQEFDVPEDFQLLKVLTLSVKLVVPCPKNAAWVAVEFGWSGLRTKRVAIPPQAE